MFLQLHPLLLLPKLTNHERFEKEGVEFIKKPDAGKMKGLAFIKVILILLMLTLLPVQDPDGYWIEILSPNNMAGAV